MRLGAFARVSSKAASLLPLHTTFTFFPDFIVKRALARPLSLVRQTNSRHQSCAQLSAKSSLIMEENSAKGSSITLETGRDKVGKKISAANGDSESQQRGQKRKALPNSNDSKTSKNDPKKIRARELYKEICTNASRNRLLPAIETFKTAVSEELPLASAVFNTLLYLSSGGNNWEDYVRGRPITCSPISDKDQIKQGDEAEGAKAPPSKEQLISCAETVWDHMQKAGVRADNVTYLSLARIEAIKGNPSGALSWAQTSVKADHPVQLRLFHPALVAFTLAGDADAVMAIDEEISAFGKEVMDLSEYEYCILIEAIAQYGTWAQLARVFLRIGRDLNQLSTGTLQLISNYFNSPRAEETFGGDAAAQREQLAIQREKQLHQQRASLAKLQIVEAEDRAGRQQEARQRRLAREQRVPESPAVVVASGGEPGKDCSPDLLTPGAQGRHDKLNPKNIDDLALSGQSRMRSPRHTGSPTAPASDSSATTSSPNNTNTVVPISPASASLPPHDEVEHRRLRPWLSYGDASRWQVITDVEVDPTGSSEVAGAPVQLVDLEEEEWTSFASAIASLAMSQETRKDDFQYYRDWYERNGPYDILVDGANIAFYGQNREGGGFNWNQIIRMVDLVKQSNPGKRVLLMLHKRRITSPEAQEEHVQAFLGRLKEQRSFYFTPPGSNDDWYWLYATVCARGAGLLVSNDLLRDHIWSLLRPKHFLKWKVGHIAKYTFVPDNQGSWQPVINLPLPYTECVQELSNGAWMFPGQDGKWLCARPASTL